MGDQGKSPYVLEAIVPIANLKVLVVDDERELADTVARLLTRKGCEVRVAYGGDQAFLDVKEFQPHLVLSDVKMPLGSGPALLDAVQKISDAPKPIVVLMTGYTDISEADLLSRGAARVFFKPLRSAELFGLLDELCPRVEE